MRILTADEHRVALLNLAVPSPILRETEPISLVRLYSVVYCTHKDGENEEMKKKKKKQQEE